MRRMWWAWVLLVLAFTLSQIGVAFADAPPQPDCWPSPIGAGTQIQTAYNTTGIVHVWYCDAGHKWARYSIWGRWSAITKVTNYRSIAMAFIQNPTLAQAQALWTQYVTIDTRDTDLQPLIDAEPWPNTAPPSGYVVTTTTVYRAVQNIDSVAMVAVGTVPDSTVCQFDGVIKAADGVLYHRIPRNTVTWTTNWRPAVVFGRCY